MQIKDILPRLRANSRTFFNVDYKMQQGFKKNYELAKKYPDYDLHPLTEKEILRVLNSYSDEFSKKNWALSILRTTLNHKMSSNTRQESKMNIEKRISILENKLGLTEDSKISFLIFGKTSYDNLGLKDILEDNGYDFQEDFESTGWRVTIPNGENLLPFKQRLQNLLRDEGIETVIKFK